MLELKVCLLPDMFGFCCEVNRWISFVCVLGRSFQLYSHNLIGLFEQLKKPGLAAQFQTHRFPDKILPRSDGFTFMVAVVELEMSNIPTSLIFLLFLSPDLLKPLLTAMFNGFSSQALCPDNQDP